MDAVAGRIRRRDLGRDIFVFYRTGRWIHSPGDNSAIVPPDLQLSKSMAGEVELRWTNRDARLTSV